MWLRFATALLVATVAFLMPRGWFDQTFAPPGEDAWWHLLPLDKFVHWGALAGLAWLGLVAAMREPQTVPAHQRTAFWSVLVGLCAYATLIEVLQQGVATRGSELADIAAGALGCLTAAVVWSWRDRSV